MVILQAAVPRSPVQPDVPEAGNFPTSETMRGVGSELLMDVPVPPPTASPAALRTTAPSRRKASGHRVTAAVTLPGPKRMATPSTAAARPVTKVPAQSAAHPPRAVHRSVRATWYCGNGSPCTRGYPAGGMYAAISPDLSYLRGRVVRVCTTISRCVDVRLIDCNCASSHAIDLYAAAFRRLAPLSAGVLSVRLEVR